MRRCLLSPFIALFVVSLGAAQSRTAVSGTVVTAEGHLPIGGAIVVLTANKTHVRQWAVTDDQGKFDFSSAPVDDIELEASKTAFVPVYYGAPAPGLEGLLLRPRANEALANI